MSDNTVVTDPLELSLATLARSWGLVLLSGLISLGFGIVLLAWPASTVAVIAFLLGIWMIVLGIVRLVGVFAPDVPGAARALFGFSAVLYMVLGIFLVKNILSYETYDQLKAATLISIFIGVTWLINGIGELVSGIGGSGKPARGWRIFFGIVGIIASIVVLAWPLSSLAVLVWVAGIWLVILGLVEIIGSFFVRGQAKKLAAS